MQTIGLTRGLTAIVDDCDFLKVAEHKWHAAPGHNGNWYAATNLKVNGKWRTVTMHVFLMQPVKPFEVDHWDGNGLNNTRQNMRNCTRSQNLANSPRRNVPKATSQYRGVYWNKRHNVWQAHISDGGRKMKQLGQYATEEDAAIAWNLAAIGRYGAGFAQLNDVPMDREPVVFRKPRGPYRWVKKPGRPRSLTIEQAADIRRFWFRGLALQCELARHYGVHNGTIAAIVAGRTYRQEAA